MTTPRPHAELAARYYADDTLRCWFKNPADDVWEPLRHPAWDAEYKYHVGHEPPPVKRTITLTTNGREWVLPEPLKEAPKEGTKVYWPDATSLITGIDSCVYLAVTTRHLMARAGLHLSEADAQAWADFDRWCRGGGV